MGRTQPNKNTITPPEGAGTPPEDTQAPPVDTQTPPAAGKKDTVEISKAQLDALLNGFQELKASNERLLARDEKRTEEIEMLKSISDKGRLAHYEGQLAKDGVLITRAKVGMWEGYPIVAWAKVKDEVGFRNGALVTNQIIRLFLDKGGEMPETIELEYLHWAQNTTCEEGEVVETKNTKDGNYWVVEMKDGRQVTLDIRFINPF